MPTIVWRCSKYCLSAILREGVSKMRRDVCLLPVMCQQYSDTHKPWQTHTHTHTHTYTPQNLGGQNETVFTRVPEIPCAARLCSYWQRYKANTMSNFCESLSNSHVYQKYPAPMFHHNIRTIYNVRIHLRNPQMCLCDKYKLFVTSRHEMYNLFVFVTSTLCASFD